MGHMWVREQLIGVEPPFPNTWVQFSLSGLGSKHLDSPSHLSSSSFLLLTKALNKNMFVSCFPLL